MEVTREDQDDINAYALLVQRRSEQVEALAVRFFFVLCCFFLLFARSQLNPVSFSLFPAYWSWNAAVCGCAHMLAVLAGTCPDPLNDGLGLLVALCASSCVLVWILLWW